MIPNKVVIDLGKSNYNFESILNQTVIPRNKNKLINDNRYVSIAFQKPYDPKQSSSSSILDSQNVVTFIISFNDILYDCKLRKGVKVFQLDYYVSNDEFSKAMFKFITFLYIGKLEYQSGSNEYLTLIKLSVEMECKELLIELLKLFPEKMLKSIFMTFLVYLLQQKYFLAVEANLKNKVIERFLLSNTETIIQHSDWNQEQQQVRIEILKKAIATISPVMFQQFATIFKKNNKIRELTYLLFYIEKYENPYLDCIENIYLGQLIDVTINEQFYLEFQNKLSKGVKQVLDQLLRKQQQAVVCHYVHSKACDLVSNSFRAHCGHIICLNCFFEYFCYKVQVNIPGQQQESNQNANILRKGNIRCLSTFMDERICTAKFEVDDFKNLKPFFSEEQLKKYIDL